MTDADIRIVEFSDEHAQSFAELNYRWIREYFAVERHDREILDHPRKSVIDLGGEIFMAVTRDGEAVGTVAMIPSAPGVFELTKMAVDPDYQGRGIANHLIEACVDYAVSRQAHTVFLESHRSLANALALYKKFGFVEVPSDPNSEYARADIRMERRFNAAEGQIAV